MNMEAIAPAEVFRICEEAIRTVAETQKADESSALREIIKAVITQEVISMNTFMANPDKIEKKWYVVDATDCTLGRMASEVAKVLRGKNKPEFTPHVDTGDYVIVINAEKIKVSGKKLDCLLYTSGAEAEQAGRAGNGRGDYGRPDHKVYGNHGSGAGGRAGQRVRDSS